MSSSVVPRISIIVPSFNSAATIRTCLDALIAQDTNIPYEIIVADSSTDETPSIVASFAPHVRLVHSDKQLYPGPARNLGVEQAAGEIFAFTDADCIVASDWVNQIADSHRDYDAVGGRILNGTPESIAGTALYLSEFIEFAGRRPRTFASIPSCNISYKRALLAQHGGFPETFWGEEYILNTGIAGGIRFAPDMVVHHVNRTEFKETVRHARKVGLGCALSRKETNQAGYLFRVRALVPLLFGYRLIKIAAASVAGGQAWYFLKSSPALVIDLIAWTSGFFAGTAPASSRDPVSQ